MTKIYLSTYRMTWKYCQSTMCSLLPKLDIITTELSTYDIITIIETHLDQTISNHNIFIDGFHPPIHKDRNRHGGGVAIYITDQIAFYESKHLSNIDKALEGKLPVFLVVDFNVNMLSSQSSKFKSMVQKQNLKTLVNCPTNFTTTEGTCIDLLITNDPS